MEIKMDRISELKSKKDFVKTLSTTIALNIDSINKVDYDAFEVNSTVAEFLVITYRGGAIAVRNCAGNSKSAIYREIGKLLDGGYYDEVEYYTALKAKSTPIETLSL